MKKLTQSFRWYGPDDPVTLQDIRQTGATDIVTALHHISNGNVWKLSDIIERKNIIEEAGLQWSVVESLPVTEEIKTQSGRYEEHIENYKESLKNLAKAGIFTVTYNFMPILDWTRTSLDKSMVNGYKTLSFNYDEVVCFDCFILKRKDAESSYPKATILRAQNMLKALSDNDKERIIANILKGLPGSELSFSIEGFRKLLESYENINHQKLRSNLILFLSEVCPIAEENNIKLVIHPDDPPFDIFGLPRIISRENDLIELFTEVDSPSNGLCFCTGSFGVIPENNLVQMANRFKERVHFLHFRSTSRDENGNFHEANHLEGDANIPEVIKVFIRENQNRAIPIPFRPDHGFQMLDDLKKITNPGYSCIGRMKGLAEIRGLETGIISMMEEQ